MLAVPTAVDVVRIARTIVLAADSHLARSAERNAQVSLNADHSKDLENARTLRDMRMLLADAAEYAAGLRASLGGAEDPTPVPIQRRALVESLEG